MPHLATPADKVDNPQVRVLLVDDNEAFLRIAADFLQRHDEATLVGAIRGGEEALVQAPGLEPQVVLVGLDRPGLETIRHLRDALPGVSIIALTPLEGYTYRQAALAAGADDVVPKAEVVTELLPAIRRLAQANRSR